MGPTASLGILGYSTQDNKAYTCYGVDNSPMVMSTVPQGALEGRTWVYEDESKVGDKMVKSRYAIVEASPTTYTFTWAMQGEDGAWKTIVEGEATKK